MKEAMAKRRNYCKKCLLVDKTMIDFTVLQCQIWQIKWHILESEKLLPWVMFAWLLFFILGLLNKKRELVSLAHLRITVGIHVCVCMSVTLTISNDQRKIKHGLNFQGKVNFKSFHVHFLDQPFLKCPSLLPGKYSWNSLLNLCTPANRSTHRHNVNTDPNMYTTSHTRNTPSNS